MAGVTEKKSDETHSHQCRIKDEFLRLTCCILPVIYDVGHHWPLQEGKNKTQRKKQQALLIRSTKALVLKLNELQQQTGWLLTFLFLWIKSYDSAIIPAWATTY